MPYVQRFRGYYRDKESWKSTLQLSVKEPAMDISVIGLSLIDH